MAVPAMQPWGPSLVRAAQGRVVEQLSEAGTVIELCPSSNMLIGGFKQAHELPYLSRQSPLWNSGVPLSISTDDPGVFNTTLRGEFILVGQALVELGHTVAEASAWLDRARVAGVDSCFLPAHLPRGRALAAHLRRVGLANSAVYPE